MELVFSSSPKRTSFPSKKPATNGKSKREKSLGRLLFRGRAFFFRVLPFFQRSHHHHAFIAKSQGAWCLVVCASRAFFFSWGSGEPSSRALEGLLPPSFLPPPDPFPSRLSLRKTKNVSVCSRFFSPFRSSYTYLPPFPLPRLHLTTTTKKALGSDWPSHRQQCNW